MKSTQCLPDTPRLAVGIVAAKSVTVEFISGFDRRGVVTFTCDDVDAADGRLQLRSADSMGVFEIKDVVIGIGFHWQQHQNQRFVGDIDIIREGDGLRLVNLVDIETYIKSVISSEMSANASPALLRAHAVISRSWVLSQIGRKCGESGCRGHVTDTELIRWYDREDHQGFDVCADDHCQRYQGITMQTSAQVAEAVNYTRGQVLAYQGTICDARFSKCCGGVMETFENCWEATPHPYLQPLRDSADPDDVPDLSAEAAARLWVTSRPNAFCNTTSSRILSQVLNRYDRLTTDFYRWQVSYSIDELSELVARKSGIDFGSIEALEPVERGPSGRIVKLCVVGSKRSLVVGKELEIRRWLSPTHLYSSAFVVDRKAGRFILTGAGWGHGVGLCQIGAAVMGELGYSYTDILTHYYPGSVIEKRY